VGRIGNPSYGEFASAGRLSDEFLSPESPVLRDE
jgi:hypothetical protein